MIITLRFKGSTLKFYLERRSDFSAFYQVILEKSYHNLMMKIKQGDSIIDAGANIGTFTVIASVMAGNNGSIISIEPDPKNLSILKKNIELNNLNNVEIIDKALYKETGKKIRFVQNGVMSKIATNEEKTDADIIDVETTTFNHIITERGIHPTILKMDIEGGEKYALLSAEKMMETINYLEGEIHSKEDFDALKRFSNLFSFKNEPVESMHNVLSFGIRHPLKILKLEYYNKFRSTKRIILSSRSDFKLSKYPIIIYGEKR
ncbi:FkbM family methyltransferase [Cuniculiplasma sp. SKW3]|uniref:FkbM family methyltransferase n=1 Tax=Cuniculiplasma sp. SKW3 TaxID=3400170 RepID=UPI003FD5239B